jgi:hypothetical protein
MAIDACTMQRCGPATVEQWMREMEGGGEGRGCSAVVRPQIAHQAHPKVDVSFFSTQAASAAMHRSTAGRSPACAADKMSFGVAAAAAAEPKGFAPKRVAGRGVAAAKEGNAGAAKDCGGGPKAAACGGGPKAAACGGENRGIVEGGGAVVGGRWPCCRSISMDLNTMFCGQRQRQGVGGQWWG